MAPSAVLQACALACQCTADSRWAEHATFQDHLKSSILWGQLLCGELLYSGVRLNCQADQQGADMLALGSHRGTRIIYGNLHSIGNIETD
jgi:hypothetical protein